MLNSCCRLLCDQSDTFHFYHHTFAFPPFPSAAKRLARLDLCPSDGTLEPCEMALGNEMIMYRESHSFSYSKSDADEGNFFL